MLLQQGEAISLNASSGGVLLLMPHIPHVQQVFEVYAPLPRGEGNLLSLVEVRWRRRISRHFGESLCLVGLKVLLRMTGSGFTTVSIPNCTEER